MFQELLAAKISSWHAHKKDTRTNHHGIAGNTSELLDADKALKNYKFLRNTQLFFGLQNAFTAPNANKYCETLFEEAPDAKNAIEGKLAVVTGVTVGEELALTAGMGVMIMGRSPKKLEAAEASIQAEGYQERFGSSQTISCQVRP